MRLAFKSLVLAAAAAATALTGSTHASSAAPACAPSSFAALIDSTTTPPIVPGAQVVDVEARELRNYHSTARGAPRYADAHIEEACEVRLSYVNPATNSSRVTVTVWLPTQQRWNGRFYGTGGGGWQCSMGTQALHVGITTDAATATTDGGLFGLPFEADYSLLSPGNPDVYLLERLGHRAIHDMTLAAKAVVQQYYGRPARKNYYIGCSTGGRQGMMEAARYPEDYDGLLLGAPAYEYGEFVLRVLAETAVMNKYSTFPTRCELDTIRVAAIEACDTLDGRSDGIVARQDLCKFAASKAVGRSYIDTCDGSNATRTVTADAARIYQAAVSGVFDSNGKPLGPGFPWGSDTSNPYIGTLRTERDVVTGKARAIPFSFSKQYVEDYLFDGLREIDWTQITLDDLTYWQTLSVARYNAIMEPPNDMRAFQQRGGKVILYHGQEDMIIPVGVSHAKLDKIRAATFPTYRGGKALEAFTAMHDFLRFFVVPGMSHCSVLPERVGHAPVVDTKAVQQLLSWVEDGVAPDRLHVEGVTSGGMDEICLWPQQPRWSDDGTTLHCEAPDVVKEALHRIWALLDLPIQLFEHLPHWLLLRTKRLTSEL